MDIESAMADKLFADIVSQSKALACLIEGKGKGLWLDLSGYENLIDLHTRPTIDQKSQ